MNALMLIFFTLPDYETLNIETDHDLFVFLTVSFSNMEVDRTWRETLSLTFFMLLTDELMPSNTT